jgi:hypothetical protein
MGTGVGSEAENGRAATESMDEINLVFVRDVAGIA